MDNSNRNVHNSGPLGMLMKEGQIKKIDESGRQHQHSELDTRNKSGTSYFKTKTGIEFSEHELMYVDPKECEPWRYANRHEDEMGDLNELIESLKANKQLQPALITPHTNPRPNMRYEIIFGRRRHAACLALGIPFLVILKEFTNVQEAIASQDAENKMRNDVSAYSNAVLYKRLLEDAVFLSEKELAAKLRLSTSSLNDLMAFNKIPASILTSIPEVHRLSVSFALKLCSLASRSQAHYDQLLKLAPYIGVTITSPVKLEKQLEANLSKVGPKKVFSKEQFVAANGQKLFILKQDQRGSPCIVLNRELSHSIDLRDLCDLIQTFLEEKQAALGESV